MSKLFVLDHPLAGNFLATLRDKETSPHVFRQQVRHLGHMLVIEAAKDLEVKAKTIETPMCDTSEDVIAENIGIVPILRAGLGLVDPFLDLMPESKVLCLGMYRNEETHQPVTYYNKLSEYDLVDVAYVIDPMLATGGSAIITVDALKKWGVKKIKFVGLIGAPEGVKAFQEAHPDVDVHLAAQDDHLNEEAYIIPGLGDAGDRIFNT